MRGHCNEELRRWDYVAIIGSKKVANLKIGNDTFQICCIMTDKVELREKP